MSSLHLVDGSEKPAKVEGQARLYGMIYCPFVKRIHFVLSLKQIPYDVVNISLQSKPQWFLQIYPVGKVPVYVDSDGTVVTESVTVANYLDEKYPEPPLYNDETKSRDLELINHFSKILITILRSGGLLWHLETRLRMYLQISYMAGIKDSSKRFSPRMT